jgi:tRNA dimethylallyltransferase
MDQFPLLIVLGPTASGKTRLAANLAYDLGAEVISADSRQVFKGMDIGTGKDLQEYKINNVKVPHHLIDIKNPGEKYQVDMFKDNFYDVFEDLSSAGILPILCGGSGMYIHSILQNHQYTSVPVNESLRKKLIDMPKEALQQRLSLYPVELVKHIDVGSGKRLIRGIEIADYLSTHSFVPRQRPMINPLVIGLFSEVEIRRQRIHDRLQLRLKNGLVEEVEGLISSGISREILTAYGLEYKFVVSYLSGTIDFYQLKELLFIAITQYAKRQMTFFRKMEKDGVKIRWLATVDDVGYLKDEIKALLKEAFEHQ